MQSRKKVTPETFYMKLLFWNTILSASEMEKIVWDAHKIRFFKERYSVFSGNTVIAWYILSLQLFLYFNVSEYQSY